MSDKCLIIIQQRRYSTRFYLHLTYIRFPMFNSILKIFSECISSHPRGRQKSRRQKLKDPTKGGRQAVSSIFQVSNAAVTECHCVVWPNEIAGASASFRNEREIRMALHIALSGIIIIPLV